MNLCNDNMVVLVGAIKTVFTLIQVAIPAVLIILGTIDMFKAMTSGDEKKTKEARTTFIKRLIYAVVAFLIPFIVRVIFSFVGDTIKVNNPEDMSAMSAYEQFFKCWNGTASADSGSGSNSTSCWYKLNGRWISGNSNTYEECYDGFQNNTNYGDFCWGPQSACDK